MQIDHYNEGQVGIIEPVRLLNFLRATFISKY